MNCKDGFLKLLVAVFCITCINGAFAAYDKVGRAKLLDDRLKTHEMMRPIGHDFFIDIQGAVSTGLFDLIDEIDTFSASDSTASTEQQITDISTKLEPHMDKETFVRAKVGLGFPIFSFSAFGARIKPNFRAHIGLLALLKPDLGSLSLTDMIDNMEEIPAEVRAALNACLLSESFSDGDDLIAGCVAGGHISQVQADFIKQQYGIDKFPYIATAVNTSIPVPILESYLMVDAKAGFFVDFTYGKKWFGHVNVIGFGKADFGPTVDASKLIGGGGGISIKEPSYVYNLGLDLKLGYKFSRYSFFGALEEVKLVELSKDQDGSGKTLYGSPMLIRGHGSAKYKVLFATLEPFVGFHVRDGYGIGDGLYVGGDASTYFFGNRLGVKGRLMFDVEHISIMTRFKLWIMHLELMAKLAMKDKVNDDVKSTSQYSANLRIFF